MLTRFSWALTAIFLLPLAACFYLLPRYQRQKPFNQPSPVTMISSRIPVHFISHGGPPSLFDTTSTGYRAWTQTGQSILSYSPKALVVVSAHWENPQHSPSVLINEASTSPLIYDFYGFPPHYYTQTFPHTSAPWLVSLVKDKLRAGGNVVEGVPSRGLDHGAWVPAKVMFPKHTEESFPIVQVSLPGDGSAESSIRLGEALAGLRDEGVAIVCSGQPVHNLRDFFSGRSSTSAYGTSFLSAISSLVTLPPTERIETASKTLLSHPSYKQAHPTIEHLLPLFVAIGAGGKEGKGTVEVEDDDGALGWGFYRFD